MSMQENVEFDITIIGPDGMTLRELERLRVSLHDEMQKELANDDVKVYQEAASRSLDPAIVGTIGLALLPIAVGRTADFVIKWFERHKDCSVTISVPIEGSSPVVITYNPQTTPPDKLKLWLSSAIQSAQLGK